MQLNPAGIGRHGQDGTESSGSSVENAVPVLQSPS
jgi:hypothetical protein